MLLFIVVGSVVNIIAASVAALVDCCVAVLAVWLQSFSYVAVAGVMVSAASAEQRTLTAVEQAAIMIAMTESIVVEDVKK